MGLTRFSDVYQKKIPGKPFSLEGQLWHLPWHHISGITHHVSFHISFGDYISWKLRFLFQFAAGNGVRRNVTFSDIIEGTGNFHQDKRIGGDDWSDVYRATKGSEILTVKVFKQVTRIFKLLVFVLYCWYYEALMAILFICGPITYFNMEVLDLFGAFANITHPRICDMEPDLMICSYP